MSTVTPLKTTTRNNPGAQPPPLTGTHENHHCSYAPVVSFWDFIVNPAAVFWAVIVHCSGPTSDADPEGSRIRTNAMRLDPRMVAVVWSSLTETYRGHTGGRLLQRLDPAQSKIKPCQ